MDIKVSVIIPIYNVESFLTECLESVLSNFRDFNSAEAEALLIDDGSTDSSGIIAADFCRLNPGFHYFCQSNKGLSEARNTGLAKAKGKYIFFLDSDDILEDGILLKLYTFALQNKCGITQCGINYYFGDSRDYYSSDTTGFAKETVISRKDSIGLLVDNIKIKNFACGKLYESGLIKDRKFRPGKYFEDSYWQYKVICSDTYEYYGILPVAGYKYRQRESSITGPFSLRYIDLLEGSLEMCRYMAKFQPEFFQQSTYRFWKNLLWFDTRLKQYDLDIDGFNSKRIRDVHASFNELSHCLDRCKDYRMWRLSPFLYRLYSKFTSGTKLILHKLHLSC